MELNFRELRADEIECRVQTLKSNGFSLLLYKDARCDMKLLDETVGASDWESDYEVINNNLFAEVRIWDSEKKMWISKKDVGTESYTEKEKGEASDSFKRACFKWGIGRELYTAPFIWIKDTKYIKVDEKTKKTSLTWDAKFYVKEIEYRDGKIEKLVIVDSNNNIVFSELKQRLTKREEFEQQDLYNKISDFVKNNWEEHKEEIKEMQKKNKIKKFTEDKVVFAHPRDLEKWLEELEGVVKNDK